MKTPLTRRDFIKTTALAGAGVSLIPSALPAAAVAPKADTFSFVLLGDLHFDRPAHHNMTWLKENKPDDFRQSQNYSRITAEMLPRLFATVRETITELNRSPETRVALVLQAGDLVEGLCGSEELAARQNVEALEFIQQANLGAPFLFTKGNHDVTGPGAVEAFGRVFHPFLAAEAQKVTSGSAELKSARYTVEAGNAQFVFFDAYDGESLAWFESVAARRSAQHVFVAIHPPVVPYGARAAWYLYSGAKDRSRREKLLELLAREQAVVIGGHIHKFSALVRSAGRGRFAQLAVCSVIDAPEVKAKDILSGILQYNGDQIRVELNHSPGTELERRAIYAGEHPFMRQFEYADLPGYAVVRVNGAKVEATIYSGITRQLWKAINMSKWLVG